MHIAVAKHQRSHKEKLENENSYLQVLPKIGFWNTRFLFSNEI